jgi:DNA helicase-2/ATP-dependent DNA helicase PcrA
MSGPLSPSPGDLWTARGADDLLADLNDAQREAVTHPAGPLLVVAGAGTGKTRVLTRRVAWRIAHGAPARSVLAITFTNKAANVLKERLRALPGGGDVTAGTFHGFCAMLLRRWADRIGGSKDFSIADTEDQTRILRDVLSDLGASSAHRPEAYAHAISRAKNGGPQDSGRGPRDAAGFFELFPAVAEAYASRLRAGALYDFDDLLLEAVRLLRESSEARDAIRERWTRVLVDEYQDTNGVQADLLKELVGDGGDLTVVGDPDQSIYRWRGAVIRNILEFGVDFPGAAIVKLERNYRSTARILAAAEAVIERNEERHEKRLHTENPAGEKALEVRCRDAVDEGQVVARRLRAWRAEGTPWNEMAVFFRVNHVSRGIETALRAADVPYEVVSGVEFFQRREVKDVLAYARLLENPRDEAAFSRVVNVPRRGVGSGTMERLRAHATALGVSLAEAAALDVPGVARGGRAGLDAFLALLTRLRGLPRGSVADLLQGVVESSGYLEELLAAEDDLERSRSENVTELIAAARQMEREGPLDLRSFLERTSLVSDQDAYDEDAPRVSLMTVHAAKGLEFDGVIVVGAEQGWFPHARNADSPSAVEEERRLFYVALTRAKRRLAVTIAAVRDGWKGVEPRLASPFWLDVPDDLVEVVDPRGVHLRERARRQSLLTTSWDPIPDDDVPAADDAAGSSDGGSGAVSEDVPVLARGGGVPAVGEAVLHPFFGRGLLVSTQGRGQNLRVVVDFEVHGTKTLLWTYARLSRADDAKGLP